MLPSKHVTYMENSLLYIGRDADIIIGITRDANLS